MSHFRFEFVTVFVDTVFSVFMRIFIPNVTMSHFFSIEYMEIEKIGILKTPKTPIRDHLYTRVRENVTIYYKAVENTIKQRIIADFIHFVRISL